MSAVLTAILRSTPDELSERLSRRAGALIASARVGAYVHRASRWPYGTGTKRLQWSGSDSIGGTVYALITRLRFKTDRGPELEAAETERQLAMTAAQDGFRAFVLVKTGSTTATIVRIYDTRDDLAAGFAQGWTPQLGEEFAASPERLEGEVLVSRWIEHPAP